MQCDAVRHSRAPLTAKQVNSDAPWFCCTDCAEARALPALRCASSRHSAPRPPLREALTARPGAQVAAALADETNAPRRPLDEHPQYTFELVRHDPALPAGRDAGCADYTASVVASALKIFAASFAPLILDDGRDMCAPTADAGMHASAPALTWRRRRMELICNSHFDPNGDDNVDYSA